MAQGRAARAAVLNPAHRQFLHAPAATASGDEKLRFGEIARIKLMPDNVPCRFPTKHLESQGEVRDVPAEKCLRRVQKAVAEEYPKKRLGRRDHGAVGVAA